MPRTLTFLAVVLLAATSAATDSPAASPCPRMKFEAKLAELRAYLKTQNYRAEEIKLGVDLARRRAASIGERDLNDWGKSCGLESVRAFGVDCTIHTFKDQFHNAKDLDKRVIDELAEIEYGRKEFTAREMALIGLIGTCYVLTKEYATTIR